jgi:hypothetical protein
MAVREGWQPGADRCRRPRHARRNEPCADRSAGGNRDRLLHGGGRAPGHRCRAAGASPRGLDAADGSALLLLSGPEQPVGRVPRLHRDGAQSQPGNRPLESDDCHWACGFTSLRRAISIRGCKAADSGRSASSRDAKVVAVRSPLEVRCLSRIGRCPTVSSLLTQCRPDRQRSPPRFRGPFPNRRGGAPRHSGRRVCSG